MVKKIITLTFIICVHINATMRLISPAFSHNEAIPAEYTCDGANISPALAWSDVPEKTRSFALVVDDPDAPKKTWVHWIVFNIPVTVSYILQNAGSLGQEVAFTLGSTDFNASQKWSGPCPPNGTHHYHFNLYALDTMLDLPAGATKEQLLSAMHGHILEKTTLIGTYKKSIK